MTIDYSGLRKLDLNLLLALNVLIEEVNVTRAAEKLNMSQSAMSYSLKRLRMLLDDPILVRSSRDMEATPYARQISVSVGRILSDIQSSLLEKKDFTPNTSQGDFRIASSDYVEILWSRSFFENIAKQAPGIRIQISDMTSEAALDSLDNNSIDLAVGIGSHHRNWHLKQELYREDLVCVAHEEIDMAEITLDDYLRKRHISLPIEDLGQDANSSDSNSSNYSVATLSRNVVWSTPHFLTIPFLLASCDCVALLPRRLATECTRLLGLKMFPPPMDVNDLTVSMFWHQRNDNLAQHQWLRAQIMAATQGL